MNIYRLIPKSYRRRGGWVALSILAQALLDFVGLAVLLPVIILVADRSAIETNPWLHSVWVWGGFQSTSHFALAVCGTVIVVLAIKGALSIFLWRTQNRYIMSLYRYFSERLFNVYHNRGLLFIKGKNSAKLTHEINFVCLAFVVNVLTTIAAMGSNIVLLIMMLTALCIYKIKVAGLLVIILIPVIWLYFKLIRGKLQDFGRRENEIRRTQNRLVIESLQGYAEIEIAGAFPSFEKRFDEGMREISDMRLKTGTVAQIPSVVMDICIAVALAVLVTLNADAVAFGIFAVAAIKILPTIKSVVNEWIIIKNYKYTVEVVEAGLAGDTDTPENTDDRLSFKESIRFDNVSFAYPDDTSRMIIDNFTAEIHKGDIVGIKGVSGKGKTTLFNILLGFYPATSGKITIDGQPLDGTTLRKWHNIIGYVPQNVFIMDSTIAENIAMSENIDRQKLDEVIHKAQLSEFISTLPQGADSQIGEAGCRISGGQKQRLGIARALYKNAEVLLFDEATSSLDNATENEITTAIEHLSQTDCELTMLIIAHRDSSLSICDHIIEI